MKIKLLLFSFVLLYSVAFSQNSSETIVHDLIGTILTDLKKFIPEYIQKQNIPGVSIALVYDNNSAIHLNHNYSKKQSMSTRRQQG
jgi:hypothetical protein